MRIGNKEVQEQFYPLPEDVLAVIALMPSNLVLFCGHLDDQCKVLEGYVDVIDELTGDYVFVQGFLPVGTSTRRFISWVRAGMPEGYNDYHKQWAEEEED